MSTNREEWLQAAADGPLRDLLRPYTEVPPVHISVGWPSTRALSTKKRRLGECWSHKASKDGQHHIFVTPLMHDAGEVLAVLVHELIHAAVGTEAKHRGPFAKVAKACGLEGKMTATVPGAVLSAKLAEAASQIGAYPHPGLDPMQRPTKKQTTRMLKCICPKCGYVVRTSRQWLEIGLPICPDLTQMVEQTTEPTDEGNTHRNP